MLVTTTKNQIYNNKWRSVQNRERKSLLYSRTVKRLAVWQKIDDKTYYFEADGAMKKGLLTAGDKQYYLDRKEWC